MLGGISGHLVTETTDENPSESPRYSGLPRLTSAARSIPKIPPGPRRVPS